MYHLCKADFDLVIFDLSDLAGGMWHVGQWFPSHWWQYPMKWSQDDKEDRKDDTKKVFLSFL